MRSATLRRLTAALALGAVLGLTAACGGDTDTDSAPADAAAGFPRTVQHAMGSTTIKTKPERVVVLDTPEASAALLAGVKPIAAVSVDPVNKTYPAHVRAELEGVPDVGPLAEPNIDKILSLKPDLIISSKQRHEKIYDRLSQIAPTVFAAAPGSGWQQNIGLFAQAMGREKEAEAALTAYRTRAKALGEAAKAKNNGTMPTFSIVRFVDGPTRLYQPSSFSGTVLADAGLARPASQQDASAVMTEIGPELIEKADADYVFVCAYGDPAKTQQAAFQASPLWNSLTAVKNQRVIPVSDDTWMTGIGVQGAHLILDDIAKAVGVDAPR
ncbi:iron-siderophore ABC transporter substrate-binding protein [Micromonospora sp. CPCC 206060]|uniref:ABC transporter substrate-binding protein n=1 Tax=Micromonospora sp. CPCC 206060 TaxID=3122406 RepID=UPI002FF025D1